MEKRKIVFATNNAHKLSEARDIIGADIQVLSLADIGCHDDIPETAPTLEGNALQKARYIYRRYRVEVFSDDTGLEVAALGGAPGVHTARYAGPGHDSEANVDKLLREMQGKADRQAQFRTAVAHITATGEEHVYEGVVRGLITGARRGTGGFGYDPVFQPEGHDGTFAELGIDVKNQISHRARAMRAFCQALCK